MAVCAQATEDVQQGLTQDDFDMYYETWEKFDEAATQYIPLSQLSEFVDTLEEPLRLPAPNLYKLVSLNIPICEDDRVHCVDILDALTKNFLGTAGDTSGDLGDIKKGPERVDYNPVTTTLQRQREMFVARLIQRMWRKFVKRRHEEALLALADESCSDDEFSLTDSQASRRSSAARTPVNPAAEQDDALDAPSPRLTSPLTSRPTSRLSERSDTGSTRSAGQREPSVHDDDDDDDDVGDSVQ